jgi:fatty acid-binding protein DegV
LKSELEKRLDLAEIEIYELSPVIGTHAGPGTLGIALHTTQY